MALGRSGEEALGFPDVGRCSDGAIERERLLELGVGLGPPTRRDQSLRCSQASERLLRNAADVGMDRGGLFEPARTVGLGGVEPPR